MAAIGEDNCKTCGKPTNKESSGSLTVWVAVCKCDLLGQTEIPVNTVRVCLNCKKRIGEGRAGTFTQWIFRADVCMCEHPLPVERSLRGLSDAEYSKASIKPSSVTELSVDEAIFPNERFAPLEKLGSSSSGVVYLCLDRLLNTRVAVKCSTVRRQEDIVRIQGEVKALSRMSHPGIVQVLDFSDKHGSPYMVMEYVDGYSLAEYMRLNGHLSVEEAVGIVKSLCRTLAYCHDRGVYHRDIKPENIMVVPEEDTVRVKVVDFGIASLPESTSQESNIVGTPLYMPPDVTGGGIYDARSEVYALGCVMFELLTGRPPFQDDSTIALLRKHAEEKIPELKAASGQEFDPELDSIVSRCLAKEPSDRYQSMGELKDAIDELPIDSSIEENLTVSTEAQDLLSGAVQESSRRYPSAFNLTIWMAGLSIVAAIVFFQSMRELPAVHSSRQKEIVVPGASNRAGLEKTVYKANSSTIKLKLAGPYLDDEMLNHLASAAPNVERLTLLDNTGVTSRALRQYWSVVRPGSVMLEGKSCDPRIIETLSKNGGLRQVWLTRPDREDLAALPTDIGGFSKLLMRRAAIDRSYVEELRKKKTVTYLVFEDCRFADLVFDDFRKLSVKLMRFDHCFFTLYDLEQLKYMQSLSTVALLGCVIPDIEKGEVSYLNRREEEYKTTFLNGSLRDESIVTEKLASVVSRIPLTELQFHNYRVKNSAIKQLENMKSLERLYLIECTLEPGAGRIFQSHMPDCKVTVRKCQTAIDTNADQQ